MAYTDPNNPDWLPATIEFKAAMKKARMPFTNQQYDAFDVYIKSAKNGANANLEFLIVENPSGANEKPAGNFIVDSGINEQTSIVYYGRAAYLRGEFEVVESEEGSSVFDKLVMTNGVVFNVGRTVCVGFKKE